MTGEITLHGKVLAIGGLKEKLLAAQREGLDRVLLPEKNRAVFTELPDNVKQKIDIQFVKDYAEVFEFMFGETVLGAGPLQSVELTATENLAS